MTTEFICSDSTPALKIRPQPGDPVLWSVGPTVVSHRFPLEYKLLASEVLASEVLASVGPFSPTPQGGVQCDELKMELHRPYPFQVGHLWFVAVRHSEKSGDVGIYSLEK